MVSIPIASLLLLTCCGGGAPADPGPDGAPVRLELDVPDPESDPGHGVTPWAVAVVGSDYFSTAISILQRSPPGLFREAVIHSGSAQSGLSVALSGDIVLPGAQGPGNHLVLIDRHPNSVLTILDPATFEVQGQLSLSTGFASNPHDLYWLDAETAVVTRYEANPSPGRLPHDGGDDLLLVDPLPGTITGRIPLTSYADEGMQARPDRLAVAGDFLWVSLNHLARDYSRAGPGRLLALDPQQLAVVASIDLPGLYNCGGMVAAPKEPALYVCCSGLLLGDSALALEGSGIARIELDGTPRLDTVRQAGAGGTQPFGFTLDLAAGRWLLAVRFGDLGRDIPDRLVAIDLADGSERVVHEASSAWGLGGLLVDDATDSLLVGDADESRPAVYRYRIADGLFTPDSVVCDFPATGLPPRQLAFY